MSAVTQPAIALDVRRVGGRIGAEVHGVDLRADLRADVYDQVRAALLRHKALVFRDANLDDAQQVRFAARFGPLTTAHPTVPAVDGQPNVLPVDGEEGVRANRWHTDVTFVHTPPAISTLRAVTIPAYGGNTLIANTAAAYQDLPQPLRAFADTLQAVHTNDYDYVQSQFTNTKADEYHKVFVSLKYQTIHPVVRVHPETGERGLFIGGFAQRVVGLSTSESRDVLRLLQAYVTRPENVLRVQWNPGDLVVFDNRITQHYAPDDYGDQPRKLFRVTVAGDVPVGVDGASSQILEGDTATHYTPEATR
ncbi:MAG TPA: TauD/TfdA family dioxygenase [Rugosimonospora sp.]|nr:TauD/TfdA family dioxygenase [Rugosimonospora sp.]